MLHCYHDVTCCITTLTLSCSYPPGRRRLQTAQRPLAVGAVSLQGSGYYICRCICCCAPRASRSLAACPTCWAAPGARRALQSYQHAATRRLPPACNGGGRATGMTVDLHSHQRLHCLIAVAAQRRWRSAGSDKNLVRRHLYSDKTLPKWAKFLYKSIKNC